MLKRIITITLLCSLFIGHYASAKTKECLVKPSYDIVISSQTVQITNQQHHLIISPNGQVTLDDKVLTLKPAIQKEAKTYQTYLRKQLPLFENQAYWQLNDVRLAFETAIRAKLGNDSDLLKRLNSLHGKLLNLLNKSIVTRDNVTYFYHQPFNNIKKEGQELGEKIFYKILGDSIRHFNIFKNYSAIKKIAKNEWKGKKKVLKAFDEHVCELITEIDNQYNHLMIGVE